MNRLALLAATALCALALAGCTIGGPADLVSEAEIVTPLPDSFAMVPYDRDEGEPDWTLQNDEPLGFARNGNGYLAEDGAMTARLAPIAGEDDLYLLAVTADDEDEAIYGTIQHDGDILAISMVFRSVDEALTMIVANAPQGIGGDIRSEKGGIEVTRRDTLDYLLARLTDGTLETRPLLVWIGTDPAPLHITEQQDRFVAVE